MKKVKNKLNTVLKLIPHRPPFLFVDKIIEITKTRIKAVRKIKPDEYFFQGHYPGFPMMPGVLICEAIFQSGAILLSHILGGIEKGVPVLTRIKNVKFKHVVKPGDLLKIEAELIEKISDAFFLKGKAWIGKKTVTMLEFACTLMENPLLEYSRT